MQVYHIYNLNAGVQTRGQVETEAGRIELGLEPYFPTKNTMWKWSKNVLHCKSTGKQSNRWYLQNSIRYGVQQL